MVMLRGLRVRRHLRAYQACRRHRPLPGVQRARREKVRRDRARTFWARVKEAQEEGKRLAMSVEIPLCNYELFPKDRHGPAEYCPNEANELSEYCDDHDPDRWEPDWDDRRKELLYDCD